MGSAQETGAGEAELVAIVAPRPQAAEAVTQAWDRGEAVVVVDPALPVSARERLLAQLRPTQLLDAGGRREWKEGAPTSGDVRAVVTTSGTTGTPKAVELTNDGLEAVGSAWAQVLGSEPDDHWPDDHWPDDHWVVCVPLHHVVGLAILARARATGARVTVLRGFDVTDVATTLQAGGTLVSLVPTMLHRLLEAGVPIERFRRVILGGAPLSAPLRARARASGVPFVDSYGLTETWGGVAVDGRPIPGVELDLSSDGEVLVRGAVVMRGYRHQPEATAAAFTTNTRTGTSRWLRTGDIGELDTSGSLRILDRRDDLVITGGVNVSPSEIEAVLVQHPTVADVCVAGVPNAQWGERVVAYVVPRDRSAPPTLDELRAYARDHLAAAKLPREVVVIDAVPRSASGKTLRTALTSTS